jgi:type II secretory pathway pseudopilin PulG
MEKIKEYHKAALASAAFLFQQLAEENQQLRDQLQALQTQLEQYRKVLSPEDLSLFLQAERQASEYQDDLFCPDPDHV